jgi:hypothetical protein
MHELRLKICDTLFITTDIHINLLIFVYISIYFFIYIYMPLSLHLLRNIFQIIKTLPMNAVLSTSVVMNSRNAFSC